MLHSIECFFVLLQGMEDVYSLIQSLNSAEKRVVQSYFSCFSSRNETKPLYLKLFLYLQGCKQAPSDEEVSSFIYDKAVNPTYRSFKSRFKDKLLEAINLDMNIERSESLDDINYIVVNLRKKLSQFYQLYHTKGNHPLAIDLLNSIIKKSSQYEIYSILSECLSFKKSLRGFIKGLNDFNELNKQIGEVDYCNIAALKAIDYYYQITMWEKFHPNESKQKKSRFLQNCIVELKKDYTYTQSAIVNYYLKQLEIFYFDIESEYAAAKSAAAEMFETLKSSKAVYRRQRIGFTLGNIAHYDIYLGNYDKAVEQLREAQTYFPPFSNNYYVSKEQEFFARFYDGNLHEAQKVSKALSNAMKETHGDFRLAQYRYYYACVLFSQKNYKAALKQLAQQFEISKDKTGWDIGIRLLTLMCRVELQHYDQAEILTENLRKHVEKFGVDDGIRLRDKLIMRALHTYARNGFSKTNLPESVYNTIDLLSGNEKEYKWLHFSPELIPMHQWLAKKLGKEIKVFSREGAKRESVIS